MNNSLASAASRGGAITIATQAIKIIVHFASVIVLARLLPAEAFGLVAIVLAIVGASDILRDLGLSTAAIQAPELKQQQASNLFWLSTGMGGMLAAIVCALAHPIAAIYGEAELVGIVLAISPVYLLNGITTQFRAQMIRDLRFRAIAVTDVVPVVLGLSSAIVGALLGIDYWALVLQQLVIAAVNVAATVWLARWRPGKFSRRVGTRELVSFGLSVTGSQLLGYLGRNADVAIVGFIGSPAIAGAYSRSYQLVMSPITQVSMPMTKVAMPILSRVFHQGGDRQRYLVKAQMFACYCTATIYFLGFGQAEALVAVALGDGWEIAIPLFQALCAGGAFRAMQQVSYWGYLAAGLPNKQLVIFAVAQPLIVIGMLIGTVWGAPGVAWASSIAAALYWAIAVTLMSKNIGIPARPLIMGALLPIATVGLPIGAISVILSRLLGDAYWASLGISIAAAVLWVAAAAVVFPPVRRDVKDLARFARLALKGGRK